MCLLNTDAHVWQLMEKVEVSQMYGKLKGQGQRVKIVGIKVLSQGIHM